MLLFDSHAHYDADQFDDDRDSLLSSLNNKGICGIINAADSIKSCYQSIKLAQKYPYIWATVGIHPHNVQKAAKDSINILRELAKNKRVVAIGEIGLDYHYDFSSRDIQKIWFSEQLALACEIDMPVVIHDREAHNDIMQLLKEYQPRGVVHCYSGSLEMAKELVSMGFYLGFTGVITFHNAAKLASVAEWIPQEKMLIETDCPYMSPEPFRGRRNDSTYLTYVIQKIAQIRHTTPEEIAKITINNTRELYKIDID
jgi:TatD DNase family protein